MDNFSTENDYANEKFAQEFERKFNFKWSHSIKFLIYITNQNFKWLKGEIYMIFLAGNKQIINWAFIRLTLKCDILKHN